MAQLPKSYNPEEAERKWYEKWASMGYFRPEVNPAGRPFSIVIPPPNVTGSLHMGHALNATLQDVLVRWQRMRGRRALWVPGTDHAGIATQNVVEKSLAVEGTDRHALGRDAFVERVWQWKGDYGDRIIHQLRKMGASADWSRQRFTLDEGLSRAVREVFVRLYEEGLVYRATRLINWCPRCKTALSDLEVEHEEVEGSLTYISYPMLDGRGSVTVATTRPETMLGDTAVAVNPRDERYREFVGKLVELPLTGRKIPVITDEAVDPEFGTGALKITPGHDFNDEAVAKRQSPALPTVTVIGDDGRMNMHAGAKYEGLDRFECRRAVLKDLEEQGYLVRREKYTHSVGHCYRCRTIIEPLSTPQWYVRVKPLAEEAVRAVREKRIRILPEGWENSYFSWMENITDWCITRQIWWGHRVPVWYCDECREVTVARRDPEKCSSCGSADIRQDPDVLDTWFSSALWPFSTLGWPEETEDLRAFYPTDVLVTAFDILFFWVARMIMMGLKFMGDVPFRDVYIHAIVRDPEGQKMSKSKGNVIDPLVLVDRYGADAFRFTLAAFAAQGRDIRFAEERVQGYRHFINKLWNATKFILMNRADSPALDVDALEPRAMLARTESLASRWILGRLAATAEEVNSALAEHRFNDAAGAIYQFTWHEFCDWYIEATKAEMSEEVGDCLLYTLEKILRLLHPFMPFVTEEIWQALPVKRERESVMISSFPVELPSDGAAERMMGEVIDAVTGVRNIRGELNISPGEKLDVFIKPASDEVAAVLKENVHYIERLARAKSVFIDTEVSRPKGSYTSVKDHFEVYVKLAGIDVEGELKRLEKEKRKIDESILFLKRKLHNAEFLSRAPEHVVEKEQRKYDDLVRKQDKVLDSMQKIRGLKA
ncbi:MAG: valine--tRNA ligase [Nitrospirota bacterium]|jgi:valyl-tRNA synthetase